jgi:hypothetical protein
MAHVLGPFPRDKVARNPETEPKVERQVAFVVSLKTDGTCSGQLVKDVREERRTIGGSLDNFVCHKQHRLWDC